MATEAIQEGFVLALLARRIHIHTDYTSLREMLIE